ncbi:hypothetical protein [Luteimonas deserti]|uniref:Uncharacterized protein n=1 Tax=Luteimonas deserti TaxID=2752306 RepID=A0A7Z0QQM4_9GAMM|nr:hypothetical protein [Luteimonas deserti]NYZ61803.1 hypothetical protein [Luteimonas deserti]
MSSLGGTFTDRQIVDHFLTKHSSIDGVLLICVDEKHEFFTGQTTRSLRFDLRARGVVDPRRLTSPHAELDQLVRGALKYFPEARLAPYNAARLCLGAESDKRCQGRYRVISKGIDSMSVSVSSRDLIRLLAGDLSQEDFLKTYQWGDGQSNPFALALAQGRSIQCE